MQKSKAELESAIVRCFQKNKKINELLVTSDGQCFFPQNKSFADLHARQNKLSVKTVNRDDFDIPVEDSVVAAVTKRLSPEEYETATVPALKDELNKREIAYSANSKPETLIKKLIADDEAKAEALKKADEKESATK